MTALKKPRPLKSGDTVAIVAPSGIVEKDYIDLATRIFSNWGLNVEHGENLFAKYHQFAGSDVQRLSDLQNAFDRDDIRAVFCGRGGYGMIRIIDQLHWHKFSQDPKWIIGFSDITSLHSAAFKEGVQSLHSVMPINIGKLASGSKPVEMLKDALFNGGLNYTLENNKLNRTGTEKAVLVGGNLSLLYALSGTPYDIDWSGKILFIEDVGEQYYHIDRMMQSFRLAGKLDGLNGLIIGGLSEMSDNKGPFGRKPDEIIADVVSGFDFPVAFDFPAGHITENCPLIIGSEIGMEVTKDKVTIKFYNG